MAGELNTSRVNARIKRTKARLTRLALFDAFWLPVALIGIVSLFIVFGVFSWVTSASQALIVLLFAGLIAALFIRGVSTYRAPTLQEAERALDATSPERPLSALKDYPATRTPEAREIWSLHRNQLMHEAGALVPPRLVDAWKARDPLALRFILPLLIAVAAFTQVDHIKSRLIDGLTPDVGALFGADQLEVSAWVTPPDYTGEAPVFFAGVDDKAKVPTGSVLTLRVQAPSAPTLVRQAIGDESLEGPKRLQMQKAADGQFEVVLSLKASQSLSVRLWGERVRYEVDTAPDGPPTIRFVAEPMPSEEDRLEFIWVAKDDYGLEQVALLISPEGEEQILRDSDIVGIDLDRTGITEISDQEKLDLTRHRWAGSAVTLRLRATDAFGQEGLSDPVAFTLPEKLFLQPLARATQEARLVVLREDNDYTPIDAPAVLRQSDVLDAPVEVVRESFLGAPQGVERAGLLLDSLTFSPEGYFEDLTVYLGLRRAYSMLEAGRTATDIEPVDDLLWAVALRAEHGSVADAARALEAARRALERALRDGASEEEIRRLMQAFRDAAENYIAARMAEALANGPQEGGGMGQTADNMIGGQDLEDMLSALEDLTETGANDAARQLLSDVSNLLNNLEFQTGQGGGSGGIPGDPNGEEPQDQGTEEEQALQGALDRLSELLEEQRRLNDDTLQERFGTGERDPFAEQQGGEGSQAGEDGQETPSGPSGEAGGDALSLAERQAELLEDLEAFSESLERDGGNGSGLTAEEFEQARRALSLAQRSLERDDLGGAQAAQDQATQALRGAAGELAGELDERRRARRGQDGEPSQTDPLGRPAGGQRDDGGEAVDVPDEGERQRARDILDDVRRRLDEATDPEEREYLQRLLDRF